jgi:hypothetical protein
MRRLLLLHFEEISEVRLQNSLLTGMPMQRVQSTLVLR